MTTTDWKQTVSLAERVDVLEKMGQVEVRSMIEIGRTVEAHEIQIGILMEVNRLMNEQLRLLKKELEALSRKHSDTVLHTTTSEKEAA